MERLTKRLDNGEAVLDCDNCGLKKYRDCTLYGCRTRIMKCLAAYEDTGLTPEECGEYKKFEDEVVASGKTFGRLVELLRADKDGRCVVLPCKGYSEVDIVRDGVSYRPDHWNIHLTAYAHEQNTPSGLKVGLFDIGEVERAMEGRKDG